MSNLTSNNSPYRSLAPLECYHHHVPVRKSILRVMNQGFAGFCITILQLFLISANVLYNAGCNGTTYRPCRHKLDDIIPNAGACWSSVKQFSSTYGCLILINDSSANYMTVISTRHTISPLSH